MSTRRLLFVEVVSKVSPHAHFTVTTCVFGWMPSFISFTSQSKVWRVTRICHVCQTGLHVPAYVTTGKALRQVAKALVPRLFLRKSKENGSSDKEFSHLKGFPCLYSGCSDKGNRRTWQIPCHSSSLIDKENHNNELFP